MKVNKGHWAVVTGASDGIGRAFCIELSRKGYNVVLLSRNKNKLDAVAQACRNNGVKTLVIPVDFSTPPIYVDRISSEIVDLEVDVLVNNVGMVYPEFDCFLKTDPAFDEAILNVNIQVVHFFWNLYWLFISYFFQGHY